MKRIKHILLLSLVMAGGMLSAQEVITTNMLEMAPYRHYINPAFEPITDGYYYLPVLGHLNLTLGQNSLTMSDVIFNQNGVTMTALHPNAKKNFIDAFRPNTLFRTQFLTPILAFGTRTKKDGYFHFAIDLNTDFGLGLPRGLFDFVLGGGMHNLNGLNTYNLKGLGVNGQVYMSIGAGYSEKQTDEWTWGFKVKLIDGIAYAGMRQRKLKLEASPEEWALRGNGYVQLAGPFGSLPATATYDDIMDWTQNGIMPDMSSMSSILRTFLVPKGYGLGFDLGATYQPHKMVKISLSLTDIGAAYWTGNRYKYTVNAVYDGLGDMNYSDFVDENGQFQSQALVDTIKSNLQKVYQTALQADGTPKHGFLAPLTMKMNVGVDAYFCNNIIGLGLYSKTMLFNSKLYEELTLGAALRPCTWFNFALSYSFINGRWSNLGTAIGLRGGPFALTFAADYAPLTWAEIPMSGGSSAIPVPYKTKGFNMEMGLAIVWGWKSGKNKDSDKDGVRNAWDMCPNTPKEVRVDAIGCPLDTDGDGVPDYLDECDFTPVAAYGQIDEKGCPIDTDGDGVPDYEDECPNTQPEVFGFVDEHGCALDSDGDGVEDYRDECPNTPEAARGHVDEKGCELDSDGDGVPDYKDMCPNTPAEALGKIDENGCPIDSDGDGVPDYLDMCPNTPEAARGHVDEKGCELDSDGDGVPDYKDMCPDVPGLIDNKGCPAENKEIVNIFKKAMQGIQFETGKAKIKPSSYGILDQVAKVFIDNPNYSAEVQGHTDNVGKPAANLKLSDDRAKAVREYLIKKGVEAERLTAKGYGDTMPIESNATAKGRSMNRRVEFDLTIVEKHTEIIKRYAEPEQQPADSVAPAATDTVQIQ